MGLMNPYLIQLLEILAEYNSIPNQQAVLTLIPNSEKGQVQFTFLDKWNDKITANISFSSYNIGIEKIQDFIN
jgi:hypothetical protein